MILVRSHQTKNKKQKQVDFRLKIIFYSFERWNRVQKRWTPTKIQGNVHADSF